jgi:AcrR family transcriptional regulator
MSATGRAGAERLGDRKSVKQAIPDRRVVRTRQALLEAFFGLVSERRYEEIKVHDIVERAGVGRSTLYEHFPGKNAILATSLRGPFSVLAGVIRQPDDAAKLVALLAHFWSNRALARAILTGPMRQRTVAVLTGLIEQRLKGDRVGGPNALIIPIRLAAIQLAEALLAPITAWLLGESRCSADALALALRKTASAIIAALSQRPALYSGPCSTTADLRSS